MSKFMVSIIFGKDVIGLTQYKGTINGEKYAQMICEKFQHNWKSKGTL